MKLILLLCAAICLVSSEVHTKFWQNNCPDGQGVDAFEPKICHPCREGSYASAANDACLECHYGYTNGVTGATDVSGCIMCKEGFEKDPDMGCKRCDKGTFSDVKDAESCTPCPEGQTTMFPESKSADDCYDLAGCQPGEEWVPWLNRCEKCHFGTYSPDGVGFCTRCPQGTTTSEIGATSEDKCS